MVQYCTYVYKSPWTYVHMIFNVFCKSAHNCEMEMQTFSGCIAVIQLSKALSFRHLSDDNMFIYSYPVEIDPMAFTLECTHTHVYTLRDGCIRRSHRP